MPYEISADQYCEVMQGNHLNTYSTHMLRHTQTTLSDRFLSTKNVM